MAVDISHPTVPRALFWTGWVITALPIAALLMSASMKFIAGPDMVKAFTQDLGYPENTLLAIGIAEVVCTILYAVPQTAMLGAILLTGYLGGATATHVRIGEAFLPPIILGVLVWLGLLLRDRRLWALLPIRF